MQILKITSKPFPQFEFRKFPNFAAKLHFKPNFAPASAFILYFHCCELHGDANGGDGGRVREAAACHHRDGAAELQVLRRGAADRPFPQGASPFIAGFSQF